MLLINGERVRLDGQAIPVEPSGPEGIEAQLREFLGAIREEREPEASGQQVCATTLTAPPISSSMRAFRPTTAWRN